MAVWRRASLFKDTKMAFGKNLKAAREAKGLTQEQLARLLDDQRGRTRR